MGGLVRTPAATQTAQLTVGCGVWGAVSSGWHQPRWRHWFPAPTHPGSEQASLLALEPCF